MIVKNRNYKNIKKSKKKTRLVPYSYSLKETKKYKIVANNKKRNKKSLDKYEKKKHSKSEKYKETLLNQYQQDGGGIFNFLTENRKVRKLKKILKKINKLKNKILSNSIILKNLDIKFTKTNQVLNIDNQALFLAVRLEFLIEKKIAINPSVATQFNRDLSTIRNKKEVLNAKLKSFAEKHKSDVENYRSKIAPFKKYTDKYNEQLDKLIKFKIDNVDIYALRERVNLLSGSEKKGTKDTKEEKQLKKINKKYGKLFDVTDDYIQELYKPLNEISNFIFRAEEFIENIENIESAARSNENYSIQIKQLSYAINCCK